ncbi:chitin synthase f [Grosmannia clavigera kw1407]|uniref:chitin synthase n=1 Tax=Grosmannia clavigera (strain kw1407 / UAMH 11150) TaxID=655863 RepID=F0XHD1_GROCL|nr:chitin synthase f [Grosmannia clavigera kw1407]EFX03256.1 chitin synthase f [Grosmannia clavigera kw1407]
MSQHRRPGGEPPYDSRSRRRQSSQRRSSRASDVDTSRYHPVEGRRRRANSSASFEDTLRDPDVAAESLPLSSTGDMSEPPSERPPIPRKRSLVRPERNRIGKDHPNYHYRKHAANMNTAPSSTGNDPIVEDLEGATDVSGSRVGDAASDVSPAPGMVPSRTNSDEAEKKHRSRRRSDREQKSNKIHKGSKRKRSRHRRVVEPTRPPSLWLFYCYLVTFWCPDFVLRYCFHKREKEQQRAWGEKMGLISIIMAIMALVGFQTFGFTAVVCRSKTLRLRVNHVDSGYMIFHGLAYDLTRSKHPAADGIPAGTNVLYGLSEKHGGQDGSFLFQNVNGRCKNIITLANNSDVPTNSDNDLAWYFPCNTFNQDGSSEPNSTVPYYLGYGCHTTAAARNNFYLDLKPTAHVYYTWDDVKNSSRNLVVYSGIVLDLDLLYWFNEDEVTIPNRFKELRDKTTAANKAIHGRDVTRSLQASGDKDIAECFEDIIKVGTVASTTVGCIAFKVVLYMSLVLIFGRCPGPILSGVDLSMVHRQVVRRSQDVAVVRQAEAQSTHRRLERGHLPRAAADAWRYWQRGVAAASSDRNSKRASFLPTTSRFTAVSAIDHTPRARTVPTTMASQNASAQLSHSDALYSNGNDSRSSFLRSDPYGNNGTPTEGYGPAGFIHEAVVPQPPSDWMPWGFPLAHSICLVTAYSEGEMGLRTTLDSIAMTDYPNSHKVILVICDGLIKGKGESMSTPDISIGMMKDLTIPREEVQPFSYVAVASGAKRHNMAKIYAGFYDYGAKSRIPIDKQQRVPMMVVVKCGTPDEETKSKPGNRGKRDSQIILMSFLQKVMFDERMTELEFEMFNGLWKVTGISPDFYEIVLMVDADTKVFPDSLTHMVSAMVKDPEIMGLCGETKIANKRDSWVTAIQVFEYFISHHLSKSFESVFGGVTCLPGCFCMYRIKAPKGAHNYWVPILANPDVVEHYSENVVDTLHKKNLLLLGEARYLTTLMLRTFPKRKQVFIPQAVCKTTVPDTFAVLLSQRRRWINSTVHNLMELALVRDLCGTFCFSMQFVISVELIGTLVLPAAIAFTFYVVIISIVHQPPHIIPLVLLGLILGLPGLLVVITAHSWSYVGWMFIYLMSLPIWNFVLPTYAFWKFDDFSWGDTRKTSGEQTKTKKAGIEYEGEFDSSKITMKRWAEFERERRSRTGYWGPRESVADGAWMKAPPAPGHQHYEEYYTDA